MLEITQAFFIQTFSGALLEEIGKSAQMAERRAQIMGDGVRECFQLPVCSFELRGAFVHPLFQLPIKFADFYCGPLPFTCIADDCGDEPPALGLHRAEADLDWKFRPVSSSSREV